MAAGLGNNQIKRCYHQPVDHIINSIPMITAVLLLHGYLFQYLEFHIVSAHKNFTVAATDFLLARDVKSIDTPTSLTTFRIVLTLISGVIGSLLTFPGLRLARCHLDSLLITRERPFLQAAMYVDLLLPVLIMSLWVPAIFWNPLIGQFLSFPTYITTVYILCNSSHITTIYIPLHLQ